MPSPSRSQFLFSSNDLARCRSSAAGHFLWARLRAKITVPPMAEAVGFGAIPGTGPYGICDMFTEPCALSEIARWNRLGSCSLST